MNRLQFAGTATIICGLVVTGCSPVPAEAPSVTENSWTLDGNASQLSYVTIKAGDIAETNSFEGLAGSVSQDGAAQIEVDLASVSTGVDIRDERMRDILFVVADHPTATVTASIDPASLETLATGQSLATTLDATLSLKGIEAPFQADVTVTRVSDNTVLAVSDAPVLLDAGRLELSDGLAELQELAGLPSITPVVPVTFSLTFKR